MKLIQDNPYRMIGLLVGATAAEQRRQLTRLQRFLEAEQEPEDDYSFPFLGKFERTLETVREASSKLNLDSDKMAASLFWFYKGNPITDEPAFDAIKESNIDQVINIWTKLTSNGLVTQRNASAYSNLGTLYLSKILEGTPTHEILLEQGISLKLKFLESDFIKELKGLATDETFKATKKDLQLLFLNQLQAEIERNGDINSTNFLKILIKQEFSAKEDFLKGFVQKPIEQIEKKIEEAKSNRKANKRNSIKIANILLAETKEPINQLKSILGTSNIRYSSIADKLAMEFFACGRDHFMHFRDTSTDPSENTMKLFKNAKAYAVGSIAKQQIDENIKDLQEWINDKPERDLNRKIGNDVKSIIEKLNLAAETLKNKGKYPKGYDDPYSDLPLEDQPHNLGLKSSQNILNTQTGKRFDAIVTPTFVPLGLKPIEVEFNINLFRIARDTVKYCKPKLDSIKNATGSSNELFQKLSNDVASISLACLIDYVNNNGNSAFNIPPSVGENEINAMNSIGELEMNIETRKRYNEQKEALNNLKRSSQRRSSPASSNSGGKNWADENPGCLIALIIGVIIFLISIFSN